MAAGGGGLKNYSDGSNIINAGPVNNSNANGPFGYGEYSTSCGNGGGWNVGNASSESFAHGMGGV